MLNTDKAIRPQSINTWPRNEAFLAGGVDTHLKWTYSVQKRQRTKSLFMNTQLQEPQQRETSAPWARLSLTQSSWATHLSFQQASPALRPLGNIELCKPGSFKTKMNLQDVGKLFKKLLNPSDTTGLRDIFVDLKNKPPLKYGCPSLPWHCYLIQLNHKSLQSTTVALHIHEEM